MMRGMRFARQIRRFSYSPAPGAGGQDNSSFFTLLGLAGVVGGVGYVYYDPDVLPEGVKKWLPIQEPEGKGMSLEEYEQWRAKQAGYPSPLDLKKEEAKEEAAPSEEEQDVEPPSLEDSIPIPHGDVAPAEMKASLEKLLAEARENEAGYIAEIKASRMPPTQEDREMLQAFKDEKARLKKQLKFLKNNK